MRQIKFRGKSVESGEWVYGMLVNNLFVKRVDKSPVCYIVLNNEDYTEWDELEELFVEVLPESVCQYIGIQDENGKEIYEGDIDGSDEPMYVAHEDGCYGLKFKNHQIYFDSCINWDQVQIIGNIYDNPELLN